MSHVISQSLFSEYCIFIDASGTELLFRDHGKLSDNTAHSLAYLRKWNTAQGGVERLNEVGLRLAVLQHMIPYRSFYISNWKFIAYSRIPFVVESNDKLVLALNLDDPNHWIYDASNSSDSLGPASSIAPISSLLRSGTCSMSKNSLLHAIVAEVLLWMSIITH